MVEMPCNSKKKIISYHCACASDLHGNMVHVIKTLNSVCLSLFLDMFPPSPHPRPKMTFCQRNVATYIHNICKWHLGSRWGTGLSMPKKATYNWKLYHLGGKYSVSKYTEASTVQIYKMVSCRRGWITIYPALSVFYACIVLKIAHTVDNQNF